MFVSYKWLQEYVDLDGISPEELAEKITRTGIEVESVAFKGKALKMSLSGMYWKKKSIRTPIN